MKKKNKVKNYIKSLNSLDDKLIIVTGANSGLGYEISKVALLKGAKLVMACRNEKRALSAKEKLIEETHNSNIEIVLYDQSDFDSVRKFAKEIIKKYSNFFALVLNAGLFKTDENIDELHISKVYKTNYLGALLLLNELSSFLNTVKEEKRIIIQGSMASFFYKYRKEDKFIYGELSGWKQYSLSKLCCSNLYFHFKENNQNEFVKLLLCEPGVAATNLFSSFPKWLSKIALPLIRVFANDSEDGALSACKLMCDEVGNGDYYRPKNFFSSSGLPKKAIYPQKYVYPQIITKGLEIIDSYDK